MNAQVVVLSFLAAVAAACGPTAPDPGVSVREPLFARAREGAAQARPLLAHCRTWLAEEIARIDPETGLLFDSAGRPNEWNTQDTAADVYPFFAWSARLLAPEVFERECRRALEFERTRTCTKGRLPWTYDKANRRPAPPDDAAQMFGASEYAKDGLAPIVELVGRGPWADRLREIEEDCFAYALWETPDGKLPMDNLEVNGDHLQSLPRLYGMTGERRYLEWAERVAEHYLVTKRFRPVELRDHNCEIISGFALLYAVEKQIGSPKATRYEPLLKDMLDYIVDYGLTPEGLMHARAHVDQKGPVPAKRAADLSHNWGYNYTAFLIYADLAGAPAYARRVDAALASLGLPMFHDVPWAPAGFDRGLADSVEGAIYLLSRRAVPEAERWVDAEMRVLDGKKWPLDKFGSNIARTALLYARMKTRGVWVRPWREDVAWGAMEAGGAICVSLRVERDWSGRVEFDSARYRTMMGFKQDYPRINYLPAYYVADPGGRYRVSIGARSEDVGGEALIGGYPLEVRGGDEARMLVERIP